MKTPAFISMMTSMVAVCSAIDPLPYLNVVDTSKTCYLDSDCSLADLEYIDGNGKPTSNGEICCASFPREARD